MKLKPIKLHTTDVEYPLDYRRKAYIQTNDKRFIEKTCVDFEGKLVRTVDVYLKQDVDKYFVRKKNIENQFVQEINQGEIYPRVIRMKFFNPNNELPNEIRFISEQKVKDAIDKIKSPMVGYSIKKIFSIINSLKIYNHLKNVIKSELLTIRPDVNLAKYYDNIEKELGLE